MTLIPIHGLKFDVTCYMLLGREDGSGSSGIREVVDQTLLDIRQPNEAYFNNVACLTAFPLTYRLHEYTVTIVACRASL